MGQIYNHADSVHFVNQFASQWAYTVPLWLCLSRRILQHSCIGKFVMTIVRQSRIADTKFMEAAQVRGRVTNLMESLDAEWRDELAVPEGMLGALAVDSGSKMERVRRHDAVHDINLVQRELDTCIVMLLAAHRINKVGR